MEVEAEVECTCPKCGWTFTETTTVNVEPGENGRDPD